MPEEPLWCKAPDLATLFDLSLQRIHQLVKEGILEKHAGGKLDRDASVTAYCRFLRGVVKQQGSGTSNTDLKQSRTDLLKMQQKNAELVYQQKTGAMIPIDVLQTTVNEGTAIFVGQKRSMGSRLAGKLAGMTSPTAILKLLNSENDKILKATSDKLRELSGAWWASAAQIARPPPNRSPSEWANENRVLPPGSPEPGPWRSERTPYTIAPGLAAVSGQYKHVFVCMMAQGGKTQGFFNVIGQRLDDNPVPILFIGPSKSNITGVIEPKVDQMLRSSESLWTKTSKGKKYSIYKKVVSGVILRFAWAGSTTEIKSDSACIVIVDEIDETDPDINGQGDIVSLADARHSAYPDGITIGASTPTIGTVNTYTHPDTGFEHWEVSDDVESLIWRYWQGGTRHEWAWPCPECDEYFIPRLKLLWWPAKSTPEQAERDARLVCPKCGSQIETKHKTEMNARGVYVAPGQWVTPDGEVQGDPPESSDATYWVSGLANFSSKKTFGFLAHAFLKVARSGDPDAVKGVLNAEFGECFKVRGDAPEWEVVRDLGKRSHYQLGQVPSGTVTLVCGVDVQKNRLVYVVRGFGEAYGSALIERGELWGETDQPDVWLQLSKLLTENWDGLVISKMAVDSGYRPEPVYDFCRRNRVAIPTKGHDHLDKPYYAKLIDCNIRGRLIKNGIQLWHFDSDSFKSWVHSRIEWPEDQPGVWKLPIDIDEDYCKQIVAEQRVQKPSGGVIWIQTSKDNHFLDCEALAYLAIRINGIVKKQTAAQQQQRPPPRQQQPGRFARNGL